MPVTITDIYHDKDKTLTVTWKNGTKDSSPFIYLRDNCQCPSCFEASAKQRLIDTAMLIDIHLEAKSLLLENTGVTIEWPDGHESYFESEWLWERRFPKTAQQQTDNSTCIKPKPVLWNSVMNSELHKIEFENVVDTDESLHAFLSHLSTHGIVVLKNAPILQNQLFKIAEKVGGHVRKTHYG